MDKLAAPRGPSAVAVGVGCGVAAATFWAAGFVAARHGLSAGLGPADLALHRFFWSGIALLPLVVLHGGAELQAVGWLRAAVMTLLGGPLFVLTSFAGFLLVPLGHGGVIQPSCAALSGLLLATFVLKEPLSTTRAVGAAIIVGGLAVIGGEALATIGVHGVGGDLMFVATGLSFGIFGMLLRLWHISALRAVGVVSVISLVFVPFYWLIFGFGRMFAAGFLENLLQALVQGVFAGPASIYLFTHSVGLLGAGRAAVFPTLVPGLTLLIGFIVLGEVPSTAQLIGFGLVLVGFRLTQRA